MLEWLNGRKTAIGILLVAAGAGLAAIAAPLGIDALATLGQQLQGWGAAIAGIGAMHKIAKGA